MNDSFRQKLLNWFCTIGLVLIASFMMPLQYWFVTMPEHQSWVLGPVELSSIAGPFGETLLYYVLVAPIALLWHWFDFIETRRPRAKFVDFSTRYVPFLALIAFSVFLFLLIVLKVWEYNSCDELPDALFWECIVYPSPLLMIMWLAAMGLALALTLFKAGFSLWSVNKKII